MCNQTVEQSWVRKKIRTLRSSLVRFRALAMMRPSRTKTHPTGTSPAARASSAYVKMRFCQ